ncbi:MAG: putative Ig domain-containing protein [Gammaproteobacteria bacterium]
MHQPITASDLTVTTTGNPTPSITESGALPSGISFVDNGDGTANFNGQAATGTSGTYPVTITASNGVGSNTTQSFTLTITTATSAPAMRP